METPHRYPFTLGDFFAVWGVKLGPARGAHRVSGKLSA
jgi:hypothetical protein